MNSIVPYLLARDIYKRFDDTPVLTSVDLDVQRGEIVCLLGPSGCGKTTLLRIIAGLLQPDQGQVLLSGKDITTVPVHQRDFVLMFQEYALFPHLSVADNIGFGLQMRGWSKSPKETRVGELLELVNLPGYGERKVYELSGGQQQRVALARSLAPNPRLLMLDEPLGSLDRVLRDQLLTELRQILKHLHQTALYVTHDQLEAFAMADKIILMNAGHIEQEATPSAMYLHPASPFVATFLGFKNVLDAKVLSLKPNISVQTPLGVLITGDLRGEVAIGDRVDIVIRPEGARIVPESTTGPNVIKFRLAHSSFRGAHTLLNLKALNDPIDLEFEVPGFPADLEPDKDILLKIDPSAIIVLK